MYTADFETTTNEYDCRVWAWGLYNIKKGGFSYGNNITSFFEENENLCKRKNKKIYFHNLKFDGVFLMDYLLKNGYEWVENRKELDTKTFCTLITDGKIFYSIEVCFNRSGKNTQKIIFLDSLKLLPFTVDKIAKAFNLPIEKLKIDYHKERPRGHKLTFKEIEYLKNDVEITGRALKILHDQKMNKMTTGSNALEEFKNTIGKKTFEKHFPILDYDEEIRESYKGGFTYVNPKYQGKILKDGLIFDVNSLYPSIMYNKPLPYGEGKLFYGMYKRDPAYPLYIQTIRCQFEIRENHIPTIQVKKSLSFLDTEYLLSSNNEMVTLCLTSVDMDLFFTHYKVYNLEFFHGWKFKQRNDLFKPFIDKWSKIKIQANEENNHGMYTISKLMLNSLYGKFATNPKTRSVQPILENEKITYKLLEEEEINPVYLPVGTFITSYARAQTITTAQKNYNRFVYADTDSVHLTDLEEPEGMEIHPSKLGAWDHERTFIKAKYLRQKTYMTTGYNPTDKEKNLSTVVTVSGMPATVRDYVNYDNFNYGTSYAIHSNMPNSSNTVIIPYEKAKLRHKIVKGGVVLLPTHFTLKG